MNTSELTFIIPTRNEARNMFVFLDLVWDAGGFDLELACNENSELVCCMLIGPAAAPMMLSELLVAWARVRLRRHTRAQTLAGAAQGTLTSLALYLARPIR